MGSLYENANLSTSGGNNNEQLAIKLKVLSTVSGGITTIRRDERYVNNDGITVANGTAGWFNPTYTSLDKAPIFQVNKGLVLDSSVSSGPKLVPLSNADNVIVPDTHFTAEFETLTNTSNVYKYDTNEFKEYGGSLDTNRGFFFWGS